MGESEEPTVVAWQYAERGTDITSSPYAEKDADSATAFTVDSTCVVAVERAPRGGWMFGSPAGDFGHVIPVSGYRERFRSPGDALDYIARRAGLTVRVVSDFLGE